MKTNFAKIFTPVFIMSVLCVSTAFSGKTLQKSFPVGPGGTLNFTGARCHIILEGSERSDVHLRAECGKNIEDHYKLSFDQGEESLEISVEPIYVKETKSRFFGLFKSTREYFGLKPSEYLTLTVSVPQDFNPCVKDSRGSMEIRSIDGRVEAYNSRGPITIEAVSGSVAAHNSRGGIALTRIKGTVEARNSRGPISVADASGDGNLVNSRGHIEVENLTGALKVCNSRENIKIAGLEGKLNATNNRGNIEVEFCRAPAEDCQLTSSRGSIELCLPSEMGADISAHTDRGKIASEVPLTVVGEVSSSRLEGRIADGGSRIELTTYRGDIRIKTDKPVLGRKFPVLK